MKKMREKDFCDRIIEKLTKEWYQSMTEISQTNDPKWEIPKYSKKQIDRAGKAIAASSGVNETLSQDFDILNNWRASHAYPLEMIVNDLRKDNPRAIVVQRLKRLDSIIGKIKRFPDMSLYRMQDLGGCRVIVDSIDEVYKSLDRFKNLEKHVLKRENDYIQNPKESGYRSYHVVYQFQSNETDTYNKNILIEIQFRTKLQHTWATAVEMMGLYTRSQLKASMGDKDILRFFVLVSSLFAKRENTPICPNTVDNEAILIKEMKEIDQKLHLIDRLSALSVAINHTDVSKKMGESGYYVLILNYKERKLRIRGYSIVQIDLATKIYDQIEAENDKDIDVVLVSAQSFEDLREAYPNYFVDISEFISIMREILN